MNINDIIAKLLANEPLNEDESAFAKAFDAEKEFDSRAASVRRKAEKDLGNAQAEIARLNDALAEAKTIADSTKNTEIAKLQKMVENLNTSLGEMRDKAQKAEAETARINREQAISQYAKANGIRAVNGVKETTFERFFRDAVGDTDLADESAMKAVVDSFKADYSGIVASGGVAVPSSGNPVGGGYTGTNPFVTGNLTEQFNLLQSNPALAEQLASAAGQTL